jgi:uncharacterized repeat protein (TIGR03806 family)
MKYKNLLTVGLLFLLFILISSSFSNYSKGELTGFKEDNTYIFHPTLTEYGLYEGNISNLTPGPNTEVFEIATTLFVDYSEKQRLIQLPKGTALKSNGDGLPIYPNGTVMAKTFYYYKDKRNTELGRKILETRLLVKQPTGWHLGTYKWNKEQNEALLINDGEEIDISWIDMKGESNTVSFYIPKKEECASCHDFAGKDVPIGPKLRSLNMNVKRNGAKINQLKHFQNIGWLDKVDIKTISVLPNWKDNSLPLDERGRAYLDMNCAHCHNPKGSASRKAIYLDYETPFDSTGITSRSSTILRRMQSDDEEYRMPLSGITIMHNEGFELVKQYIESLEKK